MIQAKTSRGSAVTLLAEKPIALVVHDMDPDNNALALEEAGFNVLHVGGTEEALRW